MTKRLPIRMLPLVLLLPALAVVRAQQSLQDSLELQLLELDLQKARLHAVQADIWHRLIPRVSFSMSLGVKEIFFIDPNASLPYLLPRDAYRLTLSLPISEIFDNGEHSLAELEVIRLQVQHARFLGQLQSAGQLARQRLLSLDTEEQLLDDQIRMSQDLLRFRQLLFDQGKTHYDVLVRAQLDLLDARRSLNRLHIQQAELRMKVRTPDSAVGCDSRSGAGPPP